MLSLEPIDPIQQPLSIDVDSAQLARPLTPEVAADRAFKANFALPSLGKSYEEMYREMVAGRENQLREQAVTEIDLRKSLKRQEVLTQFARQRGRDLTKEDIQFVDDTIRSLSEPSNSQTIFEEFYGQEYLKLVRQTGEVDPDSSLYAAIKEQPISTKKVFDQGSLAVSQYNIAMRHVQDIKDELDQQSYVGRGADILKTLFPFYSQIKMSGRVEGTSVWTGGGLKGANLNAQVDEIVKSPNLSEYNRKLTDALAGLRRDNPALALQFAMFVAGATTSESNFESLMLAVDVTSIPGAGKAVGALARQAKLQGIARETAKSMVKAVDTPETSLANLKEAAGDVVGAGIERTTTNALNDLKGNTNPFKRMVENIQSAFRFDREAFQAQPGSLSNEVANRIDQQNLGTESALIKALSTMNRAERLPAVFKVQQAMKDAYEATLGRYPGLRNAILDVDIPPEVYKEPISTNWMVDFKVGNFDGTLFGHEETARNFAKQHSLPVSEIVNQGGRYYIKVTTPIKETDDAVRKYIAVAEEAKSPDSILNQLIGRWRTPEETLSIANRANRKAATYGPSVLFKVAKEAGKDIRTLSGWILPRSGRKEKYDQWKGVVNAAKDQIDPATGEKGYYFRTGQELDNYYQQTLNRSPDTEEAAAYFSYKRLMHMKHVLENLAVYSSKARQGAHTYRISMGGDSSPLAAAGEQRFSNYFDAVPLKELPKGQGTVFISTAGSKPRLMEISSLRNKKAVDNLNDSINKGELKLVQVLDEHTRPLRGFSNVAGNTRVRYIITDKLEANPLTWDQVPKNVGMFEHPYNFYIKQAKVVKENITDAITNFWYEGDTVIMPINIRALGVEGAKHLDQVRKLLREGKADEAKAYGIAKLPMEWKEVHSWFQPGRDAKGRMTGTPPLLNLDEPIQVAPRNRLTIDMDSEGMRKRYVDANGNTLLRDGAREGTLGNRYMEFTGERDAHDLYTLRDLGTRNKPLYGYEPAEVLDPTVTMDRALSRIIRSTFMDDYKVSSVEHWLKEASNAGILKRGWDEIKNSPFWHFHNPEWGVGADAAQVRRFKHQHFQIRQFLGIPSETESVLTSIGQRLADSMYTKFGPAGARLVPDRMLAKIADPFSFVRTIAFHAKLGLFSPAQLWVQMQTFATIFGVAGGKYATPGTMASFLHSLSRLNKNPAIIDKLDEIASKMRIPGASGWKPGELKEAWQTLEETGFGNVGKEFAMRADYFSPNIVTSGKQQFLDASPFFFNMGERQSRYGAWYTAFREFRDKNPTGRITEVERSQILNRADLLYGNMSRASNSMLHTGALSVPSQFLSYQLRMMELMFGKRLSWQERTRLGLTYAGLYGVPSVLGFTGFPAADYIRKAAIENDYIVGDNYITTLLMEGLPSTMIGMMTGQHYNVSDRYGLQGLEWMREAFRGEKTILDLLGGAGTATIVNTIASFDPFLKVMHKALQGEEFKPKGEDFLGIFKEASSFSNTLKFIVAMTTGQVFSKKETYLGDISVPSAIFSYLSGLTPQELAQLHDVAYAKKSQEEAFKTGRDKFITEYRRALRQTDPEQARQYFVRAFAWLDSVDYPADRRGQAIKLANEGYESLRDRMNWEYYVKSVPAGKEMQRLDTLQKIYKQGQ